MQAEILVKDNIPAESILEVCFESEDKLAEAKALNHPPLTKDLLETLFKNLLK